MNQIKVKELPVGYFVSSTYYLSGNKEFISLGYRTPDKKGLTMHCGSCYENVREFWCNEYNDYVCRDCAPFDTNVLGTKNIQLVAVNIKDYSETDGWNSNILTNGDMYFNSGGFSNWNNIMPKKEYEKVHPLIESGKDFFIYKVSEKK